MAIIKCKMCGGSIEISADKTYGTCDSCGSTMTFPKVSDEQRVNLFNRANHFRRQNEFDKAIAAYERILEQDNTDAEAHWGVVLSRYGIEYVEDPVSHERIPTCHRVQMESILSDTDYLAAKENAPDTYSAELYEKEAKQIAEIQKGILAISAQEEPYDVFICYKESTDGGSRTKDSTLAQDIYYQLTNDGYKVFFSRITLEDKLGKQYEPYIFAALNSAKVMLVIGTKPEYLNAVWVKNEWSRYLALMKQDRSKLLIPCYRDMDPYDLPEELSALQSQDMSKIGFMQDLLHGIKKVLDVEKEETSASVTTAVGPGVKSLLTRAHLFLEDGDFVSANEYADKVLDIDPKYAPAYMVKVQVKEKVRKEADLAYCKHALTNDGDYQKAVRFADPQNKAVYEGYNQTIIKRLEEESREEFYRNTVLRYKNAGNNQQELLKIAADFDRLKDYKDSAQQAKLCREKAERIRIESEQRAAEAKAKREREQAEAQQRFEQAELERKRRKEQERIEEERRKKRNKKTATIFMILLIILAIAGAAWYFVMRPSKLYEQAGYSRMEGKYDEAITALEEVTALPAFSTFAGIGGFEDAETLIQQCEADKLFASGDYIAAYEIYKTLDSQYQSNETRYASMYQIAVEQMESGEFEAAIAGLNAIINYSDSADRIGEFHYADAQAELVSGNLEEARAAFVLAGAFSDSQDMIQAIDDYNTAIGLMHENKWAEARTCLANLTILDSAAKLEECYAVDYAAAEALYNSGDIAGAHDAFLAISEYADSAERAAQIESDYTSAATMVAEGKFDEAIALYASLCNYQDSVHNGYVAHYKKGLHLWESSDKIAAEAELVYVSESYDVAADLEKLRTEIADDAFAKKEYDTALEYYVMLPQTDDLKAKEYQLAQTCYDEGAFKQAVAAYEILGQYELSVSRLPVARYAYAAQLFDNGEYQQAAEQFKLLEGATDSTERANQATYLYGKQLLENGEYDVANEVFLSIEKYQDALDHANETIYRKAVAMMNDGDYVEAKELFKSLHYDAESDPRVKRMVVYKDSADMANECEYLIAEAELNAGNYAKAEELFLALKDYKDSADKAKLAIYKNADSIFESGDYASAEVLYSSISEYEDSAEKVQACKYEQGKLLYTGGDYAGALEYFTDLNYADSEQLAAECHCGLGKAYLAAGNTDAAALEYALATILPEAQEMLYSIGNDYASMNQMEKAIETLWAAGDFEPAKNRLREISEVMEANSKYELAFIAGLLGNANMDNMTLNNSVNYEKIYNLLNSFELVREEIIYSFACWHLAGGKYDNAYAAFAMIKGYRDVDSLLMKDENLAAVRNAAFQPGNYVSFGCYPQTASGTDESPIEWQVLDRDGNKALLISRYALDCQPYNYLDDEYVTWETCTLRSWLNGKFLRQAFNAEEQCGILTTTTTAAKNSTYKRNNPENDTQDKVFLLNSDEVEKFYTSEAVRICRSTAYAEKQGLDTNNNGVCWWWMRSPTSGHYPFCIDNDGDIHWLGHYLGNDFSRGVRPALWVDLDCGAF